MTVGEMFHDAPARSILLKSIQDSDHPEGQNLTDATLDKPVFRWNFLERIIEAAAVLVFACLGRLGTLRSFFLQKLARGL